MCLDIGTPKNINFSFETNGKLIALGVPILKHFRVSLSVLASAAVRILPSKTPDTDFWGCFFFLGGGGG